MSSTGWMGVARRREIALSPCNTAKEWCRCGWVARAERGKGL